MSFSSLHWDILIFSFLNFHDHPVIIHLEILLRCETVQIWKIHWKLKYSESRYCFADISATKAWIFTKFYMLVNYYLLNLSFKFHKYRFTNKRTRRKHARASFIASVRVCGSCMRICQRIFMKFKTLVHKIVIDHHIKFHKDPSFRCGDICKTILTLGIL